jgi:hypothetical protein
MSEQSLHPLARQAIALSGRTDYSGWAFGLTKYVAFRDPLGCGFAMEYHFSALFSFISTRFISLF